MGDEDAFLRAIAAAPADDAPRLVYADWLDEHGDSARAEYVRLLCRDDDAATFDRLLELARKIDRAWVARVRGDYPVVHPYYNIRREVARGVLTTVYEAAHTHSAVLGRRVALRVLNDGQNPAHFMYGCQIHARLEHEHVPPLYDVGQIDGRQYAVRMFVDGDDLGNNIRGRATTPSDLVRIVTTVAAVLDAMHGRETIHGFVHPRHLLQDREGKVWVIGFGEWPPAEVIGNPLHLAPEQLEPGPHPVGPRTDVYQLAETALWLLYRRHPYGGGHNLQRLLAAKRSEDGWRTTGPFSNLPNRVTAAFRRALVPDPTQRYPTAGEFATAMAAAFEPRSRWRFW